MGAKIKIGSEGPPGGAFEGYKGPERDFQAEEQEYTKEGHHKQVLENIDFWLDDATSELNIKEATGNDPKRFSFSAYRRARDIMLQLGELAKGGNPDNLREMYPGWTDEEFAALYKDGEELIRGKVTEQKYLDDIFE